MNNVHTLEGMHCEVLYFSCMQCRISKYRNCFLCGCFIWKCRFSMHILPWVYSLSSYGDIVHSAIDTGQNKIIAAHTFTEGRIQNTIDVFKDPKLMFLKYTHGVLWGRYKLKLWSWLNFRQLSIKMLEWMKSKSMLSNNGVKRLSSINWNISCEQKLQVKAFSHIPQDDSAYVYWV